MARKPKTARDQPADLFGEASPRPPAPPKDDREGHRARLRQRFMAGGQSAVADYELLELVLFRALPRRDVKPLAKRLIARFGSVAEAIAAEPARLREVDGMGEAAIAELKIVEAAARQLTRGAVSQKPVLSNWDAVVDYCRAQMGYQGAEQFHVLFLDNKNQLIADEAMGRGTVDRAPVYPREVARRAVELQAAAVILAHNHPSGDPEPSRADIEVTKEIVAALKTVGVAVHDHVVIGKRAETSLRGQGLM